MSRLKPKIRSRLAGGFEYFVSFLVTFCCFENRNRQLAKQKDTVGKILLVNLAHLGDIVLSTSVVKCCRNLFPGASIHFLGGAWGSHLLCGYPGVDKWIEYNSYAFRRDTNRNACSVIISMLRELRKERYDLIVNIHSDIWVIGLTPFLGAKFRLDLPTVRIRQHLQYGSWNHPALKTAHQCLRQTAVMAYAGLEASTEDPSLVIDPAALESVKMKLAELGLQTGDPFIILHPFAEWHGREWDPESFGRIANWLVEAYRVGVVVTGIERDAGRVASILEHSDSGRIFNLVGKTSLSEFVALVSLSRLFLGLDGGSMHIAAALNVPVVALFGPTSPDCFGPYSPEARVVYHRFECSPCRQFRCSRTPSCMGSIKVDEVKGAVAETIQLKRSSRRPNGVRKAK